MRFYYFFFLLHKCICNFCVVTKQNTKCLVNIGFNFHTFSNSFIVQNEWTKMCQKMRITEILQFDCQKITNAVSYFKLYECVYAALKLSWIEENTNVLRKKNSFISILYIIAVNPLQTMQSIPKQWKTIIERTAYCLCF